MTVPLLDLVLVVALVLGGIVFALVAVLPTLLMLALGAGYALVAAAVQVGYLLTELALRLRPGRSNR